ncbi:S-adenosyl-L-methionine-dependent methyltransferases superfamily protein [Quillaja saponaria]|uniref:Methyltransferase n=1 Tax=Quillaja saponaria TaxID=32244 RepID=A0AAD7KRC3_QUISA|nr:S-adenosyl-L-methionine-dependent methyltransferases superfamily protein [Quillaja saponaria]
MLTSNSVAPPQTSSTVARTARDQPAETTTTTKPIAQKDASVYEDNPGDLPDDAIKPDVDGNIKDSTTATNKSHEEEQISNSSGASNEDPDQNKYRESETQAQISEETILTQKQEAEQTSTNGNNEELEGNQKVGELIQSSKSVENPEQNIVQQLVETQKEEEQNQKQLQEDKGEIQKDTQEESQSNEKDQLQQSQQELEQRQQKLEEHSENGSNFNDETKSQALRNPNRYVPLKTCMHRVPIDEAERGTKWPEAWPSGLQTPPYWLNSSQMGIYGKPAPQDFAADYEHWKRVVDKYYRSSMGITWSDVRNVMDMRAVYGGFAAALRDHPIWVLNVVNIDSPETIPIIYEQRLFGIYHDWCESFSTCPRTYDLLHADHLFSKLKKRCKLAPVLAEVDRIVRPGCKLIVRDESSTIGEVETC